MEGPSAARRRVSPYLLLTLAPLFWSVNWIIGRALHASVPPMGMTFFRWLFAVLILLPFALPKMRGAWPSIRRHWKILVLLGVVGIGSHNALAYLGLNFTTATNGVILNSFIPIMIIAIAWAFFGERLTHLQALGVVTSLGGVLAILSHGSLAVLAGFRLNAGDLIIILSMVMWSIYTIWLRWRPRDIDPIAFLLVLAVIGDLATLPFWLGEMALGHFIQWSPTVVVAMISVAAFSSVFAYVAWNQGVEQVGAQVAGLFVHLMPVFGVILAWLFLGEGLQVYHVIGIVLIGTGIWITSRRGSAAAPKATESGGAP